MPRGTFLRGISAVLALLAGWLQKCLQNARGCAERAEKVDHSTSLPLFLLILSGLGRLTRRIFGLQEEDIAPQPSFFIHPYTAIS